MSTHESKRGRALSGKPFVSHRADRDYGSTVLSVLAGALSVGDGVFGFFDTREARALRLVCSEFREAVAVVPWADMRTRIRGNVGGWRRSFPRATKANIGRGRGRHNAIVDADFVHFEGIHTLDMSRCDQVGITDAAFVHLKGIHTLKMSWCRQTSGHHGRCVRPPQGDTHARHGVLQAGGNHGRRFCPPQGDTHARHSCLRPAGHHTRTTRPPPRVGPKSQNVMRALPF
jgi:hypothetical protein